jgi:hypothetical protein
MTSLHVLEVMSQALISVFEKKGVLEFAQGTEAEIAVSASFGKCTHAYILCSTFKIWHSHY